MFWVVAGPTNRLLKCLPNCLSPTREGFFFPLSKLPRGEGNFETIVHARYDWTTGVPDDGNVWRKYRVVPRAYPSHPLFVLIFIGLETKNVGAGGEHFHCTVDPSLGHTRCRN